MDIEYAKDHAAQSVGRSSWRVQDPYHYAPRPREEWLYVPVPDAGVPREVMEAARQSLKDNARKPSKAAKRF